MPVQPERFLLPESLSGSDDPVGENPFSPGDPRHDVWSKATRVAEEEVLRFSSQIASAADPDEGFLALVGVKFNAWAKRGIAVVWSDAAMAHYDRWLFSYANGWIRELTQYLESRPPAASHELLLDRLRALLMGQLQYWKAEARRYRTEQESQAEAPTQLPTEVSPALVKWRKEAVRAHRRKHRLTADAFARRAGMSETAIRGIVKEDRARFADDTRDRLLGELGITAKEWYGL